MNLTQKFAVEVAREQFGKPLPTVTLRPVQHGEYFAVNGQLLRWDAIAQRSELILNIDEHLSKIG